MRSFVLVLVAACGSSSVPIPGDAPARPDVNDEAFQIEARRAYLIGNALTPGHDTFRVAVNAPGDVEVVDMWIDGADPVRLEMVDGQFVHEMDLAGMEPSSHEVLLSADGADVAFAAYTFVRTHPLYVVVTTDWDDPDNPDTSLALQQELHHTHPHLKLTHFVGPYTFTDPSVSAERRTVLADWVKGMRDTYDDEIGLHIHPYCSFISTTGVTCRTSPSLAYEAGDETGYTVVLGSYSEEEFTTILQGADDLFMANGLGKPTSFRAGGWSAEIHTLKALANAGYVADTSAVNWARIEEWDGAPGATLYQWLMSHWAPMGDTDQPYYPSEQNILQPGTPAVPVLEVPDNGALVDYVSGEEMIEIFQANWPGGALDAPRQFSIGYHPPNYSSRYHPRMMEILGHVDLHLAEDGGGPAVYATLSDLVQVWPQ
jgi:hypothetical protein